MKKTNTKACCLSCLALLASLLSPVLAQAAPVTTSNGTITTYDANTGNITFDWDLGSIYDITGTD
ncbi:MAG: hypothetical protein WBN96_04160, partial [Gammaproteobacteria bacterium]